ncbi:MAG: hypothetical protein KatS3mg068_2690 [Candidatus Sericytochromatia bacterium]|nr:MAG: hypothetical protein KatS3mg068_2690 [Candidatus Sericytochromatia bacterium]
MIKKLFFITLVIYLLFVYNLNTQEQSIDLIEKKSNYITINWTKGIIYSEYTSLNNNNIDIDKLEKITFENAYHHLMLALLDLYLESGKTLKESLKNDPALQKKFHHIKEKIQIKKKIVYLNKITYLLSFSFFDYFNHDQNYYIQDLKNAYYSPIKQEKQFNGIIIYISKEHFKPALRFKIFSSTGKLILYLPVKENIYYSNDSFIYQNPDINQPYVIYTEKSLNENDIIIDQKDIQFLIATKKLFDINSFKVILYDKTQ